MDIPKFTWKLIDQIDDKDDDVVDVAIVLEDGSRYVPTFFTIKKVNDLMRRNVEYGSSAELGEETPYANGVYFWAHDMVIVRELTPEVIEATIHDLLGENTSLDREFHQIPEYTGEDEGEGEQTADSTE